MFITLEGVEGCGKSTLSKALKEKISGLGHKLCMTREPGGSDLGQNLRAMLLHSEQKIAPTAELFMFLADRAQHVQTIIRPALKRGEIVICDRYLDSTTVYQGYGRGFELENLHFLNQLATQGLYPNLTLLLDLEVEIGLSRANQRQQDQDEGRFEAEELSFHKRIRQGFLDLAAREQRFVIIDASQSVDQVMEQAWQAVESRLNKS